MDWNAFIVALGLCVGGMIIEALSFSREGKRWFENLRQPKFAFPFSVWYLVGGMYYVIVAVVAYRLFQTGINLAMGLLIAIVLFNGLANVLLFKYRTIRGFYLSVFPFTVLCIIFQIMLLQHDMISALIFLPYLAWLIYDLLFLRQLSRLNEQKKG